MKERIHSEGEQESLVFFYFGAEKGLLQGQVGEL